MKKVPKTSPRMIATRDQNRFRPRLMPMNPTTRVASSALPRNQSVNWSWTFPCRSFCGM